MKKILLQILITGAILISAIPLFSMRNANMADPDLVGFAYEYYGAPSIKAGDFFTLCDISFGGFFESRNEKRFTQAPLPNHNWRGFFFVSYAIPLFQKAPHHLRFSPGFEHESAHPSQGFWENNDTAFEMIYDTMYRNVHLNSILLRLDYSFMVSKKIRIRALFDYQFYCFSKNTPEMHNSDLGFSNGASAGLELFWSLPRSLTWYISLYDRYIFKGWQTRTDSIYIDTVSGPVQQSMRYPIINRVNTIAGKTGILYTIEKINYRAGIFVKILYGNIFGLVDSREKRLVVSGGVEIFH